jgi:N-dimethylarginine dimethylaminohydrolase
MKTETKAAPRLAICPPHFFEVSYAINPWMEPKKWKKDARKLTQQANEEWNALYDRFSRLGIDTEIVRPEKGVPDMVFTANSAVVLNGKALLARFKHPERQAEQAGYRLFFQNLRSRGLLKEVVELPVGMVQEGAGDCIWDRRRQHFWAGFGPRSQERAATEIGRYFRKDVVALELATDQYYHLDVCMCPLSGGEIIYYPKAFTPRALQILKDEVRDPRMLIEATDHDAQKLAVNAVNIGRDVVMAACSDTLRARLETRGYRIHVSPLQAFGRSGGAAFCLTLRLDLKSAEPANATVDARKMALAE